MQFPDDTVLLARGRYSTLSRERREQVKRYQKAAQTAMSAIAVSLNGVQDIPPGNVDSIPTVEKCLNSMKDARAKVESLCDEMEPIKKEAWGE